MSEEKANCFVIMPFGECEGYSGGHFTKVYEDVIKPSVDKAGFKPIRGDEVSKANLIHLDILKHLIEAPMAICDLSSRNPNVLFELGIRQAFDKPVVLMQEEETPKIFDIAPLRYVEYVKDMGYRNVIAAQEKITKALIDTFNSKDEVGNVNSIVKLLALNSAASIPTINESLGEYKLNLIISQLQELSNKINMPKHKDIVIDNNVESIRIRYQNLRDYLFSLHKHYQEKRITKDSFLSELMICRKQLCIMYGEDKIEMDKYTFDNFMELIETEIYRVQNDE